MTEYYRLGLVGWPLEHSFSPILHNTALAACDMEGNYSLYPTMPYPDGAKPLAELLLRMRTGELKGLNVTVPHKLDVMPLLDEHTPTARAVGAVNTIFGNGKTLIGENTDTAGFIEDIAQYIQIEGGGQALVLGAGGGARAVVYALGHMGWDVSVASRRAEQVKKLAFDFVHLKTKPTPLYCGLTGMAKYTENLDIQLIINTTPLGMHPYAHNSPWPTKVPLPAGCFVYDLIYAPAETVLLRSAREQGLMTANGLGMLVRQAAKSFLLWTEMPEEKLPFIQNVMHDVVAKVSEI